MGTVRKTITLTDQQGNWIKAQINAGHCTNDSEYIRDLIRREQQCAIWNRSGPTRFGNGVSSRQRTLRHAELDRFNVIDRANRLMLVFVRLDERHPQLARVSLTLYAQMAHN